MVGNVLVIIGITLVTFQALAKPEFALLPSQPPIKDGSRQACLQCHGNQPAQPPENNSSPRPPLWDNFYSMDWEMYELDPALYTPPVLEMPADRLVSRGETHYDWTKRKMVEVYKDRCINIFSNGNDFSCKFFSTYGRTFLIRYDLGDTTRPRSCCEIEGDFWAPRKDVLRNMGFQKETGAGATLTQWWLLDTPLPGPFGYGTMKRSQNPKAFWFPVIGAWVQQNFFNYSEEQPPSSVFSMPRICRDAPVCEEP